jgi:hypothetical protein
MVVLRALDPEPTVARAEAAWAAGVPLGWGVPGPGRGAVDVSIHLDGSR